MWPFQFYSHDSTRKPGVGVRREVRGEANVLEPMIRSQVVLSLNLWTMTSSGETGRLEESGVGSLPSPQAGWALTVVCSRVFLRPHGL